LRVIEEGCNLETQHLEHNFVHEYEEREVETNRTPPTKRVANPANWKRFKRTARQDRTGPLSFQSCRGKCKLACSENPISKTLNSNEQPILCSDFRTV
jgi:hypothetical protein